MIVIMRKQTLFILCLIGVLLISSTSIGVAVMAVKNNAETIVVIDVGHGGIDGGVVGAISHKKESEINLEIAKELQKEFNKSNIKSILTRENDNGLYGDPSKGFKLRDMQKRKAIIEKSNPTIVISIHCNKFPSKDRRGAQVFFASHSEKGKTLATTVQNSLNALNKSILDKEFSPLKGEYYILNCSDKPSIIIECGFLSNPDDDQLLTSKSYQQKLAMSIKSGVLSFLGNSLPSMSEIES